MESAVTQSTWTASLFLISVISGIFLRVKGEPYNEVIFTVHKISIVAVTILLIIISINHFKALAIDGRGLVFFLPGSLMYLIAFISGSVLSIKKITGFLYKFIHMLSSVLLFLLIVVIWLYCH